MKPEYTDHIGYRLTGRVFLSRSQSQNAVKMLKTILEHSEDTNYFCDIDDNPKYSEIAIVFDTLVGGNVVNTIFNLLLGSCKSVNRLSSLAITATDTMLPKIHYFGRKSATHRHSQKNVLTRLKALRDNNSMDFEFISDCVEILHTEDNYLQQAVTRAKLKNKPTVQKKWALIE